MAERAHPPVARTRTEAADLASRAVSIATALPVWAWLAGIVVVSFGLRLLFTRLYPAPWLFADEFIYHELSRSFVQTGDFTLRDMPTSGYSTLYPLLLAPAYWVFENQAHAYAAAKAINALAMSLTAIPAYLLARRVVSSRLALVVAALAVAIPSMFYTVLVMTESLSYPLFILVTLLLVLILERPTFRRQLALAVALVAAYLVRTQTVAFVPAILSSVLLLAGVRAAEARPGERRRTLWRALVPYWPLAAFCVAVGAAAIVWQVARGYDVSALFGSAYSVVVGADYSAGDVARWFLRNLVDLDLAMAILPFAAFLFVVLRSFGRNESARRLRPFAFATLSTVFWSLLVVAIFSSRFAPRFEERYLFFLLPLFFVAVAVWLGGERTPRSLLAFSALVAGLLPLAFPYREELYWFGVSDSFGLWPLLDLREGGMTAGTIMAIVCIGAAAVALVFVALPRGRIGLVVPILLVVYFALVSNRVDDRMRYYSTEGLANAIGNEREWIDDALPPGASAVSIWSADQSSSERENEFFSRKLGMSYVLGKPVDDAMPEVEASIDPHSGTLLSAGLPVETEYLVTNLGLDVAGEVVAVDTLSNTRVVDVGGSITVLGRLKGLYGDTYSEGVVTYTRYACTGGVFHATLAEPSRLAPAPVTVVASSGGKLVGYAVVQPGEQGRPFSVPVAAEDGRCEVRFRVGPTWVPNDVNGLGDLRVHGVQFRDPTFEPAGS